MAGTCRFPSSRDPLEAMENFGNGERYRTRVEFGLHFAWLVVGGRVFPEGAGFGVDDPAVGNTPSVISLALGG